MFSKCTGFRNPFYISINHSFLERRTAEGTQLDSSSALERFLLLPDLFLFVRLMKEERVSLGLQPGRDTDAALDRPGTFSSRSWQPMSLTSNVPVHNTQNVLLKNSVYSIKYNTADYLILTVDQNPVVCLKEGVSQIREQLILNTALCRSSIPALNSCNSYCFMQTVMPTKMPAPSALFIMEYMIEHIVCQVTLCWIYWRE